MEREIKAIETYYNGYKFRSRLEARWAVFFRTANIEYQYEPEGYVLEDGRCYLPDFYLPEYRCYVEIKPKEITSIETVKRNLVSLVQDNNYIAMLCVGDPMDNDITVFCADVTDSSAGISSIGWSGCFSECSTNGIDNNVNLCVGSKNERCDREFLSGSYQEISSLVNIATVSCWDDEIDMAKRKARQARFEFGEQG